MLLEASQWLESEAKPALMVSGAGEVLAVNQPLARLLKTAAADLAQLPLEQLAANPPEQLKEYLDAISKLTLIE